MKQVDPIKTLGFDPGKVLASTADWATRAAERICYEVGRVEREGAGVKPDVASVNRIASIVATHAEPLVALLREAKREHHNSLTAYSGWACGVFVTDNATGKAEACTCGASNWNARVDAALNPSKR